MQPKLVVITGPTASGKTALGVALAQRAVVHEDIERRDLYVVLLDQLARKIAGAVGRNSDLHWHLRSPFPK